MGAWKSVTLATATGSLDVTYGAFPDGTVFPAKITLDVKEENLNVAIENSGYKKRGT